MVLRNEAETVNEVTNKVSTKCGRSSLQNASCIAKCDKTVITKCFKHYEVCQVLQSVTIITKSQVTPPDVTNISKIEDHSLICFTFATGGS